MAAARILSYVLRTDGVPYQMRPCLGWERLKRILGKVGVIAPGDIGEGDIGDDIGEGSSVGNNNDKDIDNSTDIRAVVLMNMGSNRNLA